LPAGAEALEGVGEPMSTNSQRPKLPVVVSPAGVPQAPNVHPYVRLQPPAHLDEATRTFLTKMQQHVEDATAPARANPTKNNTIIQQAVNVEASGPNGLPSGGHLRVPIQHGLGQAFSGYRCTRTYAQTKGVGVPQPTRSQPFSATESLNNANQDPTKILVLDMFSSGLYDVEVFA
jgi:hypothetical protein